MISAAPYRDRVVHHALCNIVLPIFERTYIDDTYANRLGYGTHRALRRFTLLDAARWFVEQQSSKLSFGVSQQQRQQRQRQQQRWFSGSSCGCERSSTHELADKNLLGEKKEESRTCSSGIGDNIANIKLSWVAW